MYTVIGGIRSRTLRVLWMLEELGEPYTHNAAAPRSDEVTALNPSGKVPVLLTDGAALTDSTAILTYLADKHGQLTYPAGTLNRARQDGITHFVLDEMDAVLWTASRHSFILPEEMRVPQIKDSLKWEFERSIDRLAQKLGDGPFLMGDTMTIADIIAAHCGSWAETAKFPLTNDAVNAYLDRMRARPALVRALAA
jgi:glutathione S-transferase